MNRNDDVESTFDLSVRALTVAAKLVDAARVGDADLIIDATWQLRDLATAILADFEFEDEDVGYDSHEVIKP